MLTNSLSLYVINIYICICIKYLQSSIERMSILCCFYHLFVSWSTNCLTVCWSIRWLLSPHNFHKQTCIQQTNHNPTHHQSATSNHRIRPTNKTGRIPTFSSHPTPQWPGSVVIGSKISWTCWKEQRKTLRSMITPIRSTHALWSTFLWSGHFFYLVFFLQLLQVPLAPMESLINLTWNGFCLSVCVFDFRAPLIRSAAQRKVKPVPLALSAGRQRVFGLCWDFIWNVPFLALRRLHSKYQSGFLPWQDQPNVPSFLSLFFPFSLHFAMPTTAV